jgi:hypothetical protein
MIRSPERDLLLRGRYRIADQVDTSHAFSVAIGTGPT